MEAFDPATDGIDVGGGAITLKVGADERSIFVHESILRKTSGFFDAALKDGWKEGEQRIIRLPEDDSDDVYVYVQWLYAGKIFVQTKDSDGLPEFGPLAKLYVLGEKLLDDAFQDRVLDVIICLTRKEVEGVKYFPGNDEINIIYKGTGRSSPARRLLVDAFTLDGKENWMEEGEEFWPVPEQFKDDLLKSMLKGRKITDKRRRTLKEIDEGVPCVYHKHGQDKPCGSMGK